MRRFFLGAWLAVGCLPSPKPVQTDYYVLAARAPTLPPGRPTATLGVSRVTLPGYLDRGEVATRSGQRITYSPTERWAEPLDVSVPRLLAEDLAAALAPAGIAVVARAAGDLSLVVEIDRFERDADGPCVVDARWTLRDVVPDRVVKSGAARYQETPSAATGDAVAAALAKALDRLGADIAAAAGPARR